MVKKWQTLIEASIDVATTDGYKVRMFCIGFTHKRTNQIKKTSYAQHAQVVNIRAKMVEIMTREVSGGDLRELVNKLLPRNLPITRCSHQKDQGPQEAEVRHQQVDGTSRRGQIQRRQRWRQRPESRTRC